MWICEYVLFLNDFIFVCLIIYICFCDVPDGTMGMHWLSFYRAFVPEGTMGMHWLSFYRAFVPEGTMGSHRFAFYRAFVPEGTGRMGNGTISAKRRHLIRAFHDCTDSCCSSRPIKCPDRDKSSAGRSPARFPRPGQGRHNQSPHFSAFQQYNRYLPQLSLSKLLKLMASERCPNSISLLPSRSAIVRATLRMRSTARAESPSLSIADLSIC